MTTEPRTVGEARHATASRAAARPRPAVAPVLVTGATGTVGGHVVHHLLDVGASVRVALRRPSEQATAFAGAAPVRFDFRDPATFASAFGGVESVFLVRPPRIADVAATLLPALDAARAAGVRRVVLLSLQGVERNRLVPHRRVEEHLMRHGPAWTLLRPGFFMQNLSTTHRRDVAERNEIHLPAGRGRTSFIDARDVAAAAAHVLTTPGHEGRAYELTGAEALTYHQVAATLSDVLGREVRYRDATPWNFWRRMRGYGYERAHVAVMLGLYTACRLGLAGRVTTELEDLVGRPATTFRRFAHDHRDAWTTPDAPARPT
jgi:uncharacterized protein YbjT (DUF2867 family)